MFKGFMFCSSCLSSVQFVAEQSLSILKICWVFIFNSFDTFVHLLAITWGPWSSLGDFVGTFGLI